MIILYNYPNIWIIKIYTNYLFNNILVKLACIKTEINGLVTND